MKNLSEEFLFLLDQNLKSQPYAFFNLARRDFPLLERWYRNGPMREPLLLRGGRRLIQQQVFRDLQPHFGGG